MPWKPNPKASVSLFMLALTLLTMLAQAAASAAPTEVNEPTEEVPILPLFDEPEPGTKAPASTDTVLMAIADVAGTAPSLTGGLWVSGDTDEVMACLQWIAGNQPAGLLKLGSGGKVMFDPGTLATVAGITAENNAHLRAHLATFLRADEGLRLLAEVMNGSHRFLLHIGQTMPTRAGQIRNPGTRVLDNRFDSRINPKRRNGQKLANESPPERFDSLIAVNPTICWFNFFNQQIVPTGQLIFHELAEAHARLVLNLDYLPQRDKPGAHNLAIDREIRLKQSRPGQLVLMPIGFNLRLGSPKDWRWVSFRLRKQSGSVSASLFE